MAASSSSLHSRLIVTSPASTKSRSHRRPTAIRCVSTTSTEKKNSRVATVKNGDDSLAICRVLNGMWQTSGGWGHIVRDAAVDAMLRYADAGLATIDMADHCDGLGEMDMLSNMCNWAKMREENQQKKRMRSWADGNMLTEGYQRPNPSPEDQNWVLTK